MKRIFRNDYTDDWKQIATAVKAAAGWRCIRCGHPHEPAAGYTLTVDHWDGDKANNRWWNLLALCQRCHLNVQARVIAERPWVFDHSPWFWPYVAGYYAHRYLGQDLDRATVEANIGAYLTLERDAVLGPKTLVEFPK